MSVKQNKILMVAIISLGVVFIVALSALPDYSIFKTKNNNPELIKAQKLLANMDSLAKAEDALYHIKSILK
jgi:hypothetical protein